LGCSAFARHYLRNHYCFLFLGVLRCFSSPRSPCIPMYSVCSTEALPPVGFPIRKSPDQSLFSGSPKLIAAYHVLHRLSLPRHPPYALSSLTIKNCKSINSTLCALYLSISCLLQISMQLSKNSVRTHQVRSYKSGGGERDRTDDLLRARQALSQLSYTPDYLVGLDGLEPSTSRLSVVCSSQLSYRPLFGFG
jgi:hypothetical protein